jgi:hypothetical protein
LKEGKPPYRQESKVVIEECIKQMRLKRTMHRREDEPSKPKEKKGDTSNKEEQDHEKIAQQLKEKAEQERRKRANEQDQKILEQEREKLRVSSLPVKIKEEVRESGENDEGVLSDVDYSPSDARQPLEESPKETKRERPRLRKEEIPKTLQEVRTGTRCI